MGLFGKKPKAPKPIPIDPKPTQVPAVAIRKDIFSQLAKRRKATLLNQVTSEPGTLRRTLGGS